MPTAIPHLPTPRSAEPAPAEAPRRRRSYPAANAPLSREQKTTLIMAARKAFDVLSETGLLPDDTDFNAWRHQHQISVGVESLTTATQHDFPKIRGVFADLIGHTVAGYIDSIRDADRELWWHKLQQACQQAELVFPAYAAAICRGTYKCSLEMATAQQLFQLTITVRNRRKEKFKPFDR